MISSGARFAMYGCVRSVTSCRHLGMHMCVGTLAGLVLRRMVGPLRIVPTRIEIVDRVVASISVKVGITASLLGRIFA